jgi:hypothetical protein
MHGATIKKHPKKVKVALRGFSTRRPLGSVVFLPQQVPAFICRGATHHTDARDLYQRRRKLFPPDFASRSVIYKNPLRSFYMPQSWDIGHIILLPLRRKAYWGFSGCSKNPMASAGFEPANSGSSGKSTLIVYLISFLFVSIISKLLSARNHIYLILKYKFGLPFYLFFNSAAWVGCTTCPNLSTSMGALCFEEKLKTFR